jgi:hypothetical protein
MLIGNTIRSFNGARLGNQMFQVGMLFSIWKKTNQLFFQPRKGEQFWNCFDVDIPEKGITHRYRGDYGCALQFYSDVYDLPGGTEFNGYFQNRLYLENYKNDIINFYKFKNKHNDYAENKIENIKKQYNLPIVSVHYRRGDFVINNDEDVWGNLSKTDYYNRCFNILSDNNYYLIFSDDISWCKNNIKLKNVEFMDIDEYKTLCLMTKVNFNIIANSTFSWFGAFLNKNSKVFIPSIWTGKKYPLNCRVHENFCINGWEKIKMEYK